MEKTCLLCSSTIVTSEFDLKPMCLNCANHYYNSDIKLPEPIKHDICQCSIEEGFEIMKNGKWHCMDCKLPISNK